MLCSMVQLPTLVLLLLLFINVVASTNAFANHQGLPSDPCRSFYGHGYCTDYIRKWFSDRRVTISWRGDAIDWIDAAKRAVGSGWSIGKEPREGAIVVFNLSDAGQVALVKSVSSDRHTFVVTQMNYKKGETKPRADTPKNCYVTNFFGVVTEDMWSASDTLIKGFIYPPWKVYLNGVGPVKVGMSPREVSAASAVPLIGDAQRNTACYYIHPKEWPKGVHFMIINGRIARIDINSSEITTLSGARVGHTEDQVKSIYPGQIKVQRHTYEEQGHYLTFVPNDPRYSQYRIVFETDGKVVTRYRAGKLPEVEWVEGCS